MVDSPRARLPVRPDSADPSPRALLTLAWIAGFTLIDASVVSLALPDIARDLDRTVAELAWVSTGFLVALASSLLVAGWLTDQLGTRRMMLAGAMGFLLTTAACGLAPAFPLLVAARIVQGVAGGVLFTVALSIASIAYPPERRAAALSILFTSGTSAAVIGPVAGGLLTDLGGWRLVFIAQLPIPIVVWLLAYRLLPAGSAAGRRRLDVAGAVTASLFVLAATLAVLQAPVPEARAWAVAGGLVAVAALAGFVVTERRVADPLVRLGIFRNRAFVVGSAGGAAAWFAIMSAVVYGAIYLQLGRGFSASEAGLVMLAPPIVALAFMPFGGRTIGRLGVDRALAVGLVLLAVSAGAMATWGASTPLWFVVATLFAVGGGIAVTLVASATQALSQFAPTEVGIGSALFNSLRQLGAGFGVAGPALAFELVAPGARTPVAVLDGSSSAFGLRFVILAVAVLLVVKRPVTR